MKSSHKLAGVRKHDHDDLLQGLLGEAIGNYQEPENDDWRSPLWDVARKLKKHLDLRRLDGFTAWNELRRHIPWEDLGVPDSRLHGASEDDVCAAFVSAWDAICYAEGEGLLSIALSQAERQPVMPPRNRGRGYGRFVSVVFALAELVEPEPDSRQVIAIPQNRWAKVLGVNEKNDKRMVQMGTDGQNHGTRDRIFKTRPARKTFPDYVH